MKQEISDFLADYRPNTVRAYTTTFRQWSEELGCTFLGRGFEAKWEAATISDAIRFWSKMQQRPGQKPRSNSGKKQTSGATLNQKLHALRGVYRHLVDSNLCSRNPFQTPQIRFKSRYLNQKRPTLDIPVSRVKEFLATPDASTKDGRRDAAICAAILGGGLRSCECRELRLGDIRFTDDRERLYLHLRATKTGRDYDHPLPEWAALKVMALVTQRASEGASDADFAFVEYRWHGDERMPVERQIQPKTFYRRFKRYAAEAGLPSTISPHSGRATAITKLLSDGVPHRDVQEFSRHRMLQSVEWYDKRLFSLEQNPANDLDYEIRKPVENICLPGLGGLE